MHLYIYAFGKLRTPGLREAADYFQRNTRPWLSLEEVELKPLPVTDKSAKVRALIQEKEGKLLLERIRSDFSPRGLFFLLDELGKARPTQQWAEDFKAWESQSIPQVGLCIGSSLGFSKEVRLRAAGLLSLGPQTLSHELARVVLFEQVYRALSINRGHPYHNEGS